MSFFDILILAAVAAGAFFAVRAMARVRRRGGCACCGGCAGCAGCAQKPPRG